MTSPVAAKGRRRRRPNDPVSNVLARVEYDTNGGCWLWPGSVSHNGYGQICSRRSAVPRRVHRLMYTAMVGEIPAGMEIDHLCRVRCCCNPAHLEAVSRVENIKRGMAPHVVNAAKTVCKNGHPFSPTNTQWSSGKRRCRECFNAKRRTTDRRRTLPLPPLEAADQTSLTNKRKK